MTSWLIWFSKIKADSRGLTGSSDSDDRSDGKDKAIITVVFVSSYDSRTRCSATDLGKSVGFVHTAEFKINIEI